MSHHHQHHGLSHQTYGHPPTEGATGGGGVERKYRAGIVGIEKQLEKQARDTEKNISEAFQDLNSLIENGQAHGQTRVHNLQQNQREARKHL